MKLKSIVAALALAPLSLLAQGNLFITGHDADDHGNSAYTRAGLDYLFFGAAANAGQAATRSSFTVGYLGNSNGGAFIGATGYTLTFIDLDNANWATTAFASGAFDALIIGTGGDYVSSGGSTSLNAASASFAGYFNSGGSLFVMSEQGLGQNFYNFLPNFGTAAANGISDQGAFTPTAAGLAIGLTNTIVDMDITHTTFSGYSNIFTVFETYDPTGSAVAIGLRNGSIDDGGFTGGAVPEPSTYGLIGAGALVALIALRRRARA